MRTLPCVIIYHHDVADKKFPPVAEPKPYFLNTTKYILHYILLLLLWKLDLLEKTKNKGRFSISSTNWSRKVSIVLGKYAVFYYFENVFIILRPCLSQQICWPLVQLCHLKTVVFLSIATGAKPSYRSLLKTNDKYLKVFVQFNVLKISPGRTTLT